MSHLPTEPNSCPTNRNGRDAGGLPKIDTSTERGIRIYYYGTNTLAFRVRHKEGASKLSQLFGSLRWDGAVDTHSLFCLGRGGQ